MEPPRNLLNGPKTIDYLPSEIIYDIFIDLPVKSLLNLMCVCKTWRSLITSSEFTKAHLKISTKSNNYSIILATKTLKKLYYTCSLSSILSNTSINNSRILNLPMNKPAGLVWFVGSCNGLLCNYDERYRLVLLNPSTGKSKTLPGSGTDRKTCDNALFGICYDDLNDDYKVVELSSLEYRRFMNRTKVKVYSSRDDSWRKIENEYVGSVLTAGGGISVGGILHWCACNNNGPSQIFAVNTVTYGYHTLAPLRHLGRAFEEDRFSLREVGGCLALFYDLDVTSLDVWVMKEYGVVESWTKLHVIPYSGDFYLLNPLHPVIVLDNGYIFINCGSYMMICNSRNNSLRSREIHTKGGLCSMVYASAYIESLVAPDLVGE